MQWRGFAAPVAFAGSDTKNTQATSAQRVFMPIHNGFDRNCNVWLFNAGQTATFPRSVSFLGFVYRRREFLDLLQHLVPSMPWTVQEQEVSSVGNRRKLGCPSGSQITLHRVQVLGTRPVIPRASHVENWKFQVARVPELLALGKQGMLFSKCPRDSYARRRS